MNGPKGIGRGTAEGMSRAGRCRLRALAAMAFGVLAFAGLGEAEENENGAGAGLVREAQISHGTAGLTNPAGAILFAGSAGIGADESMNEAAVTAHLGLFEPADGANPRNAAGAAWTLYP